MWSHWVVNRIEETGMKRVGQGARALWVRACRRSLGNALLAAILACGLPCAGAADAAFTVLAARDLAVDGARRQDRAEPVVVLFTRGGCAWCERLKQQHLRHLPATIPLREVRFDSDAPLTDFAGRATTHRRFAAAQQFRLAPTLAFYGPDGRQLAEPIVGVRGPDYMDYFIDAALAESRQRLAKQ
jgi:hypothetical protein